ncbi:MAG: glutamine amidotransferase [Hyphomonas sp.]|uniref:type 1 glutamine amidotransferase n=1 Tax=Hyphomonas sp. TaxID=87 RepID=UPI0034A0259B
MKLTIIETGQAPATIRDRFPDYPEMVRRMLAGVDAGITCETVSIARGEALPDPATLSAVLYTGSPAGVYDPLPWIAPLSDFICRAATARTPQVGICFGHQIMGEALGGKVEKSEKGWGVGRHTYDIVQCPDWSAALCPPSISVAVSHQDQVVALPPSASIIAQSVFTPYAGLDYRDFPAISFQCHPEFEPEFAAALYAARRGASLTQAEADAAVASLAGNCDRRLLAQWIASFLQSHTGS